MTSNHTSTSTAGAPVKHTTCTGTEVTRAGFWKHHTTEKRSGNP